jgi:hypothetical protein
VTAPRASVQECLLLVASELTPGRGRRQGMSADDDGPTSSRIVERERHGVVERQVSSGGDCPLEHRA